MGIKQLSIDNLRKLPNEYGGVSVMIEQYQRANSVQLYKRSSRSSEAAKSRCPKKLSLTI